MTRALHLPSCSAAPPSVPVAENALLLPQQIVGLDPAMELAPGQDLGVGSH